MSLLDDLQRYCSAEYVMERVGLDPINAAMIRHWCEAMGDANPDYAGEDPIAPPHMLGAWVMRPMDWPPADPKDGRRALIAALDDAGYSGIVATTTEQTYVRPLKPGDRIRARIGVDGVAGPKQTALGEGYFFTTRSEYLDQHDAVVGVELFGMLKFKPRASSTGERPAPAMNEDTRFFWEGIARGELLIQRCASCKALRHPPQPMCAACRSLDWDTVVSSGAGEVYSYTVHHHPPMPGFEMPYTVALVALDEGVRMLATIARGEVQIGTRVRAALDPAIQAPLFEVDG